MFIRKEQMEAIFALRRKESEESFVAYFRHTIPEYVSKHDDSQLAALIRQGTDKARVYGVTDGMALIRFLTLALVIAPNFDEAPAVKQFLSRPGIEPDVKLELLTNLVCEQLRRLG